MAAVNCTTASGSGSPCAVGFSVGFGQQPLLPEQAYSSSSGRSNSSDASRRSQRRIASNGGSRGEAQTPPGGTGSEPAGLEHLERKLRRCEALPLEDRSPEASAFLQAVQLLQQIPDLLLLDAEGRPAPAPPLHQQALAFALAAAVDSISPQAPPLASHVRRRLRAYLAILAETAKEALDGAAGAAATLVPPRAEASTAVRRDTDSVGGVGYAAGSLPLGPSSLPQLAILLVQYAAAVEQAETASVAYDAARALPAYCQLAGLAGCLAQPAWQAAVDAQLAELTAVAQTRQLAAQQAELQAEDGAAVQQPASDALQAERLQPEVSQPTTSLAPPLLTAARLRFAASCTLAGLVSSMLNGSRQGGFLSGLPAAQEARLRALAASAGAALLEQAPSSPRACLLAAYCALAADGSFTGGAAARRRALQLYQRAHELACRQRSDYFQVRAACGWLMLAATATNVGSATQAAHLEASMTAHRQAASSFRRCSRLLPLVWVGTLRGSLAIAAQLLPSAGSQLKQLQGRAHALSPGAAPAQLAAAVGAAAGKRALTGAQRRALRSGLVKAAGAAMDAAASAGAAVEASAQCCCCKRTAVGLRLCARCGLARYCSRECQVAAWQMHKPTCRPAGSSREPAQDGSPS